MGILMLTPLLLLVLVLALFTQPSHELTHHEVFSNFLREKRSVLNTNTNQEWSPPLINNERLNAYSHEIERVAALPGQPTNITFAQYSGYVTVDAQAGRALFYYFTEATEDPSTKPLLLWLNGGPGCSSFGIGAMTELGPFRVKADKKTLYNNPYSWNQVANTLFLESPAGVGFSYSNTTSDYNNTNDYTTAQDSYTFLLNWFERFPQYKNRDFYIAGESYAGYYVPQLTDTILKNNNSHTSFINLKGVMVGNGIMNDETDNCGYIDFWWSHALISDEEYARYHGNYCNASNYSTRSEIMFTSQAESQIGRIDGYNIYGPLCPSRSSTSTEARPTDGLQGFDPCTSDYVFTYLNTPEVQSALHANVTGLSYSWDQCSEVLSYHSNATTMLPIYVRMMAAGLRILVYSGDVDGVVPVTGTRYSINALKLTIEKPWYAWMDGEIEVGGYSVIYKGLTFATVRGAGHQVPSYQPSRALTMAKFFLAGEPLPS